MLALIPAAALLSQLIGGSKNQIIDNAIRDAQKQLGVFNPELARFVDQNRGAITAGLVGLGVIPLLFVPELCGDASIGEAITQPLSSEIQNRSDAREQEQSAPAGDASDAAENANA